MRRRDRHPLRCGLSVGATVVELLTGHPPYHDLVRRDLSMMTMNDSSCQ